MTEQMFFFDDQTSTPTQATSLTLTDGPGASLSGKPLLFDVSWEVCRKVGGIYTVISSKALITVKEWGDRYALIGPYTGSAEFEEMPPSKLSGDVIDVVQQKHGIRVVFGRWLVKGYPKVFLIDMKSSWHRLDEWRATLMGSFANASDTETNEAIVFGNQVALFLTEFVRLAEKRPICAHFHEWLAAVGLIRLKQMSVPVASLFTTHATLLGRWMAAGRVDLYNVISKTNPDEEAGRRQIYHKHWIEVGAARGADVFTTVSDITAYEAEHTLGRKADIITPNGLNLERFVALHEFQVLHKNNKEKIEEFIRGHFYGNLDFNLDKTLYFFTAGRREYYNKGVDVFIEALAELNAMLKRDKSDITIVAFIIMPGQTNNYNVESIKGQSIRREIRETCNKIVKKIEERMYETLIRGDVPDPKTLLQQEDIVNLKRRAQSLHTQRSLPPVVTHNMVDGDRDEILSHIRRCKLFNNSEDRVKVIYHPEFLNAVSPIFPLDYDEFVRGCHLGVFPSYYEPWGYTPAECMLMGVPSITSNLTGFANFMSKRVTNPDEHGVYIVDRRFKSFNEAKSQMASIMWRYSQLSRRQRIELRNRTEKLSYLQDWTQLGRFYFKARRMAVKKVYNVDLPMPSFFTKGEFDFPSEYEGTDIDHGQYDD